MKLKSGIIGLITLAILASCSTSNDVVSGRGIQKRKYNDGYYISLGKKFNKTNKDVKVEEVILSEETAENFEAENIKTSENSTSPAPSIEPTSNGEVIAPTLSNNESPVTTTSEIEPAENELSNQDEVVQDENTSFKPGRIYSPKMIRTIVSENSGSAASSVPLILLIILAFLIPWLAVGLYTSWDVLYTVIAVLLWLLFWLPGIIFALLVIFGVV
ncbi:MAG: YqaE/Pmp3 family membrane protein [Crocinitomicaceae bacterium]|nr:YqaE/Pmp3 family membrane protein [Crocinitomicaceae bacterium]